MTVYCVWCETELAPEDAKPIKYARLDDAPDEENMQCKDEAACDARQAILDAKSRGLPHGSLFTGGDRG